MTKDDTPDGTTTTSPTTPLHADFERLKEAVLTRRPILREVLKKCGEKTLFEYARDYITVNLNDPIRARQAEFIETCQLEIAKRLGPEVAASAAEQLQQYYFASTINHHGPVVHPWSLNPDLLVAAPYLDHDDRRLHNVIVFACANISLNNPSFPRGLVFHSCINNRIEQHRLSFLPSNAHSSATYGFRPYTAQEIVKVKHQLQQKVRDRQVGKEEGEQLLSIVNEVYNQPDVLACQNYSDQVTKTNFEMWKRFFPMNGAAHPNLIYLEQESLVVRLLINYHLYGNTTITHLLFDPAYDPLIMNYFDGIMCAFSTKENWGTYLFWGISQESNYRVQLWKQGDYLISADGSFKIELTPNVIQEALEKKQIIPSVMLIFTVLSFYYGLKCLGGFSQVNYLTLMKNAYLKAQADRGNYRSIEVCARTQTKETVDVIIAFLGGPNGELIPATGLDLMLYGNGDRWQRLMDELQNMTLEDAINPGMSDFYRFIYHGAEVDQTLAAISAPMITQLTGLDKKIKPCVTIRNHTV